MTDTIKIYRGIDELDGTDSLFAVRDDGMCLVVAYFGDNHIWLSDGFLSFNDFDVSSFYDCFLRRCKNPVLVRVVTRDKDVEQPKDYAEKPDDHCKPLGKYDHLLLGFGLFLFGVIVGIILAVGMIG